MCGKDLKEDPEQQAISIKGFFTNKEYAKYGLCIWTCESCTHDLITALTLDIKKLDALRASDIEKAKRLEKELR